MIAKLKIVCAFGLGIAAGFAAGCQTYDFEPVEPLAIAQTTQSKVVKARVFKPNLMLLVDKSLSMNLPTDTGNPACPSGCGTNSTNTCPSSCPTRITEMRKAMDTFLRTNGAVARMGMTVYPTDGRCGAPTTVGIPITGSQDVESELTAQASTINASIQGLAPSGGTPTGRALRAMGDYAGLQDTSRDNFVLVLTDGLPNCNVDNTKNFCGSNNSCTCVLNGDPRTACSGVNCAEGCLDQDATVAEITNLRAKNIKTIVVGFGADLAVGTAPTVLNAMAIAGGFARDCKNSPTECGASNACDPVTKLCDQKYYPAKDNAELAAALAKIGADLATGNICKYALDAQPSNPAFLSVLINGEPLPKTDWVLEGASVTFPEAGPVCNKIKDSTAASPVKVEFRIVQGL